MNNINLVVAQNNTGGKGVYFARLIAGVLLCIVVILSLILFFLKTHYSSDLLTQEQSVVVRDSAALQPKAAKLNLLEKRLFDIASIINARIPTDTLLHTFLDILPNDTSMDSISISKNSIALVVSSASLVSLNTYLNSLVTLSEQKHIINTLLLDNLSENQGEGKYSMSLKITLL